MVNWKTKLLTSPMHNIPKGTCTNTPALGTCKKSVLSCHSSHWWYTWQRELTSPFTNLRLAFQPLNWWLTPVSTIILAALKQNLSILFQIALLNCGPCPQFLLKESWCCNSLVMNCFFQSNTKISAFFCFLKTWISSSFRIVSPHGFWSSQLCLQELYTGFYISAHFLK